MSYISHIDTTCCAWIQMCYFFSHLEMQTKLNRTGAGTPRRTPGQNREWRKWRSRWRTINSYKTTALKCEQKDYVFALLWQKSVLYWYLLLLWERHGNARGEFSSDLYHALACDVKNMIFLGQVYNKLIYCTWGLCHQMQKKNHLWPPPRSLFQWDQTTLKYQYVIINFKLSNSFKTKLLSLTFI